MKYFTPVGGTTEVRPRIFGKSTVICTCGFSKTVASGTADRVANNHAGSCRRGTPASSRRGGGGSMGSRH
uniref:Uncharacterized protein n=1 Tax=Streptomyces sp. NBC_00008 TaxID=2903610 RepID=A0AAU2VRI2_9ACTN